MKKMRILALLLALCLMVGLLTGCGGKAPAAEDAAAAPAGEALPEAAEAPTEADADRTLRVGTLQQAGTFDPLSSELDINMYLVYDTILQRDPDTNEIAPCVASEWEWQDDTTLVLTIRDDIYFSNGEKLTPDDVLWSLWRAVNVNPQYTSAMSYADIDFEASHVDGDKVILVYKQVNAVALAHLTLRFASVLCRSYVESTEADAFWDAPVGSGAYTLVENVDGSHTTFIRNEDYWDTLPEAKEIIVNYYGEASTMYVDLEIGDLDMAINLAANDAARVINGETEGVQYKLVPNYDLIFIALPEYCEKLKDSRVREAIAYGMDTAAITKSLYGDLAEVADSTMIKYLDYYVSQGVYEYNPEKAKELLAEAGLEPNELSLRLIAPITPTNQKLGEIFQGYMADIGIDIQVEIYEFPVAIPMLMRNEAEICLGSLNGGMYDAADNYSTHSKFSTNGAFASSDEMLNEYLIEGKSTVEDAERAAAYKAAQEWDHEHYQWLPICYPMSCLAYSDELASVPVFMYTAPYLKYVTYAD